MLKKVLALIAPVAMVATLTLIPNAAAAPKVHRCPAGLTHKGSCVYVCPPGTSDLKDCVLYVCPPGSTDIDYCRRIGPRATADQHASGGAELKTS
jgi:hypothetical protein